MLYGCTMGTTAQAICLLLLFLSASRIAHAQRKLLQSTALDCTHVHPQCFSCLPESFNEATKVICTACTSPQYQASNDTCGCSPGYYLADAALQTCTSCGKGAYCPGGIASAATKITCGSLLTTDSTTAAGITACITLPGVAYMSGPATAVECPAGTYSTGGNHRNCTECPYGLVTPGSGATDQQICSAPPGYFYRNRQALPCAVGTYKTGINKDRACEACPIGTTTNSTAATSAADCNIALPGYQPLLDPQSNAMIGAKPCPAGTYSPSGVECTPCPDGLTTQQPKQTDASACLAPPGYGYYTNRTTSSGASGAVVIACPSGTYKAAWSLESCTSCGAGFLTDPIPATASDNCYLPPGYGSKRVMSGSASPAALVASRCMNGTYGSVDRHFGLDDVMPCQPCPENTATPDLNPDLMTSTADNMLMTSLSNCSNIPGFGWQHGLAVQCPIGYYSPGFDLRPCLECGEGLTTVTVGTTRPQDCVALPGWQLIGLAVAEVCATGTWSAGGSASCQTCPTGSTTAGPAASAVTDCSICAAGWGGVEHLITSQGPVMCAPCTYGTYSPGGTSTSCVACEAGYTSPARATDSSACYPQWSTNNPHTWMPTPTSALVPASAVVAAAIAANAQLGKAAGQTSGAVLEAGVLPDVQVPADSAACQAACGMDSGCQYYVFKSNQKDASEDGCWYKLQTSTPAPNTYISFKLGTGDYTIWQADAGYDAELGNPITWSSANPDLNPTSPASCIDACDRKAACLGTWTSYAPSTSTWQCKLLSGEFRNDIVSALQAVPQRINDNRWDKDCIGAWGSFGACDQPCGGGTQVATYAIVQAASSDGTQCDFADGATKNQTCNTQPCPQNCTGSWIWGECSVACGGGAQSATFQVITPAANGGKVCEAVDGATANRTCNTGPCPTTTPAAGPHYNSVQHINITDGSSAVWQPEVVPDTSSSPGPVAPGPGGPVASGPYGSYSGPGSYGAVYGGSADPTPPAGVYGGPDGLAL